MLCSGHEYRKGIPADTVSYCYNLAAIHMIALACVRVHTCTVYHVHCMCLHGCSIDRACTYRQQYQSFLHGQSCLHGQQYHACSLYLSLLRAVKVGTKASPPPAQLSGSHAVASELRADLDESPAHHFCC